MRLWLFCSLLIAACGSSSPGPSPRRGDSIRRTRVYFRQYYGGSHVFAIENLAGRDLVELRSKRKPSGGPSVAYVEDEVMEKMLSEFERYGFHDHAGPRPADPAALGGRAELTIVQENGRTVSFIRRKGQGKKAFDAYRGCMDTFLAVHDYANRYQAATSSGAEFGVKKAEFGGR